LNFTSVLQLVKRQHGTPDTILPIQWFAKSQTTSLLFLMRGSCFTLAAKSRFTLFRGLASVKAFFYALKNGYNLVSAIEASLPLQDNVIVSVLDADVVAQI